MSEEPDDIGADIAAAMGTPAEVAPVAAEAILPDDTKGLDPVETEAEKAARTRDEQGRFAKAPEAVQDAPVEVQEPAKTILPPRSWTAAAKAKFNALDPDVQQEVLRREGEMDQGKAQWDTKAELFNKLDAVLAPVKDQLAFNGMTPDTYVGALVNADQALRGPNKVQALQFLAQQYGINLGQQLPQSGPQTQPVTGQPDPQYQALQQRFNDLQSRVDQRDKAAEAEKQAVFVRQIEDFASDPAHLYFDNVKPEMAALLQSGSAKDLQGAYDMACHARPDIRALIAAAAKPAQAQTRPNGLSVTGAQKGVGKPNGALQGNSIDDDVRAAFAEVSGRV